MASLCCWLRVRLGSTRGTCLSLSLLAAACTERVPLGGWLGVGSLPPVVTSVPGTLPMLDAASTQTETVSSGPAVDAEVVVPTATEPSDAAPDTGMEGGVLMPLPMLPACQEMVSPGMFNLPGTAFGATETITDWTWPGPIDSVQWEFTIEGEVPASTPMARAAGYYFAQQFSFTQGVAGILGVQSNGLYESGPSDPTRVFTKILVFWLSGPPSAAELGDIPYPDARVETTSATGTNWLTIHALFDWQPCHVYQLRFGPHSADGDNGIWYGAWIADTTTNVTTFIGRMLLAADIGQLLPYTISRVTPIDLGTPATCTASPHTSIILGTPTANDGNVVSSSHRNRFASLTRCATSRFSEFPNAVRHELGVVR